MRDGGAVSIWEGEMEGVSFRHYVISSRWSRVRSKPGIWAQTHPRGIAEIMEFVDVGVGS